MPMLDVGVAGLALPFLADDGIVVDPSLLSGGDKLGEVVAHELARVLHPLWEDSAPDEHGKMEEFASKLTPMLLAKEPDYSWADVVVLASPGHAIPVGD
ncbi:MAG TPA: hypothetical protein VH112_12970 [Acidimicrobiales bacterium]|nr:hypothetical protein [Acidimicrobiales bacterium]